MKLYKLLPLLLLCGCASAQIDHALSNLDKDCARHYAGSVAATGGTLTFTIDCAPVKVAPATP